MSKKIAILLATYNGGNYIKVQLDSIINQTYTNWVLFVSDDGSVDSTVSIIESYCSKDDRILLISNERKNNGACKHFGNLLDKVLDKDWDFVMFADQDDYWNENKIQTTLNSMLNEADFLQKSKLVYTDFEYGNELLKPLKAETDKNTSLWKEPILNRLLAENNIYGCTMMINRVLAEKLCPIPHCAENHDYWVALVASLFGDIVHIKERTILYRQHSNNVSGHYLNNTIKARIKRYYKKNEPLERIIKGRFKMAEVLVKRFESDISVTNANLLKGYSNFEKMKGWERVSFCINNGIEKNSLIQSWAFYCSLLRM